MSAQTSITADPATLAKNLRALSATAPGVAEQIAACTPRVGLQVAPSADGAAVVMIDGRASASRRRALAEAQRWAQGVDLDAHALALVHGFASGHHIAALDARMDERSAIIVIEPDIEMLRVALEHTDFTAMLSKHTLRLVTSPDEPGALLASLRGIEAHMSFGVTMVTHPPSQQRLAHSIEVTGQAFPQSLAAARTHIVTTLMQSDTTFRNALVNADYYVSSPGIGELKGFAQGRLGVVVAAGPSFERNIDLLKNPDVRARCVVVAVQTVLKPMLARGIRPDFVTAIDYAEISKRFYEGLTAEDVAGVTLVATARSNPAIHDAWPGARRIDFDDLLARTIGEDITDPKGIEHRGDLPAAATVAHLAYSLARHLGCDPIALVGQDLAFTDGQYYADGATIHRTWAGELNAFNTIEMMEWQRIMRMRSHLYKKTDHLGRPVYSDEQMLTYLTQFEAMFRADESRGLSTIDATEGGVSKGGTRIMTLSDTLAKYAGSDQPMLAHVPQPSVTRDMGQLSTMYERLASVRRDVRRIARLSRETRKLLERASGQLDEPARLNRTVDAIHGKRDEVESMETAWWMLQRLNQTAAIKRFAADRKIGMTEGLTEQEIMVQRIERDMVNVQWMADIADHLDRILEDAIAVGSGAPRPTRQLIVSDNAHAEQAAQLRVRALVIDAPDADGYLSWDAMLSAVSEPVLLQTIRRAAASERVQSVAVVTSQPQRAKELLGRAGDSLQDIAVDVIEAPPVDPDATRARRAVARLAGACWRGAPGHVLAHDVFLDAVRVNDAIRATDMEADAWLLVGAGWCLVDHTLHDTMIEQHATDPKRNPLVFSQAAPGLAGVVIGDAVLQQLAEAQGEASLFSTLGGMIGYVPSNARSDAIARPCCISIDDRIRDVGERFVADTYQGRAAVRRVLESCTNANTLDALSVVQAYTSDAALAMPNELVVASIPALAVAGERGSWYQADPSSPPTLNVHQEAVSPDAFDAVLASLGEACRGVGLTIGLSGWRGWAALDLPAGFAPGDPLADEAWLELVRIARQHGVETIHVRTQLDRPGDAERLLEAGVDVISVDAWANEAALYERLTGQDRLRCVFEQIDHLLKQRMVRRGTPWPIIVPRITRCDSTYEAIEAFYDKWLMLCGAAAIDPLPRMLPGQRIQPLTVPDSAHTRMLRQRMVVVGDGIAALDDGRAAAASMPNELLSTWKSLLLAEHERVREKSLPGASSNQEVAA